MVELETLHALYVEGLHDLYSAETQIVKALPKMQEGATTPDVKDAFATHLEQTKEHVARLVRISTELGVSSKGKHCMGMEELVAEGAELLGVEASPGVMDAGLIASAQHVEHCEMAGYGAVRTCAQLLGYADQARLLQTALDEEQATNLSLTEFAQRVNVAAIGDAADDETDSTPPAASATKRATRTRRSRASIK